MPRVCTDSFDDAGVALPSIASPKWVKTLQGPSRLPDGREQISVDSFGFTGRSKSQVTHALRQPSASRQVSTTHITASKCPMYLAALQPNAKREKLMSLARVAATAALGLVATVLTGCGWFVTVKTTMGQPVEVQATIGGNWPAARRGPKTTVAAIGASDVYIETAGTDFALSNTGNVVLTLTDEHGAILAASQFAWLKSGSRLVFANPSSVQAWLSQYPGVANIASRMTVGSPPVDGESHVLSTAIVYQGVTQASTVTSIAPDCNPRYDTDQLCMQ